MGLLSVPLMLQTSGFLTGPLTPLETLGWGLWLISLGWEHLADSQKLNFARCSHHQTLLSLNSTKRVTFEGSVR